MITISHNPLVYRMSRREIAQHTCISCGVNIVEIGDYCMLNPDIWDRKLRLQWTDNMCIACIEKRLGRKLRLGDFSNMPMIEGFPMSDVLRDRLFGDCVTLKTGEMVARNSARGRAELKRQASAPKKRDARTR